MRARYARTLNFGPLDHIGEALDGARSEAQQLQLQSMHVDRLLTHAVMRERERKMDPACVHACF